MRVRVDPDLCQGHGRCFSLAPDMFDMDDMGHAIADGRDVPADREDAVEIARQNCPEYAIEVEP